MVLEVLHDEEQFLRVWKVGADIGSMPGQGEGQINLLLKELADTDYNGFITMEPHLQKGGQFGGVTSSKLFAQAIEETRKKAQEVGLTIETSEKLPCR